MKIRKGDKVRVISGKDIGKEGEVMSVLRERDRVIVDGVNVAKKHQKATNATMQTITTAQRKRSARPRSFR